MASRAFADGALTLVSSGFVTRLTLSAPARRNAIASAMWLALPQALDAASGARVLVVQGAGEHFAAGADMREFDIVLADAASAARYGDAMRAALAALESFAAPTIAAIRGDCIGGGCSVALACDLRLARDDARLGVTPSRLGLVYSLADTRRLVQAVGAGAARDLLFTGRLVDAREACTRGLVDEVHAAPTFDAAVQAKVDAVAANSARSNARAKRIVAAVQQGTQDDTDETRAWFAEAVEGEDFRAAVAAFERRRGRHDDSAAIV